MRKQQLKLKLLLPLGIPHNLVLCVLLNGGEKVEKSSLSFSVLVRNRKDHRRKVLACKRPTEKESKKK